MPDTDATRMQNPPTFVEILKGVSMGLARMIWVLKTPLVTTVAGMSAATLVMVQLVEVVRPYGTLAVVGVTLAVLIVSVLVVLSAVIWQMERIALEELDV